MPFTMIWENHKKSTFLEVQIKYSVFGHAKLGVSIRCTNGDVEEVVRSTISQQAEHLTQEAIKGTP